jgi:hypothetical protein
VSAWYQHDIAAPTSVSTIRSAPGNKLFPAKTNASNATISGLYPDLCCVDELHWTIIKMKRGIVVDGKTRLSLLNSDIEMEH